jgi:hypothetical protein
MDFFDNIYLGNSVKAWLIALLFQATIWGSAIFS